MEHIKTTPPELAVPSFSIELDFEANALADLSHNPGIKPEEMLRLAKRVVTETRGLTYKRQIGELEYLARKHLRMSQAETETIVNKSKEATHKIIDGAHLFQGYEAPDPDDQYRGPNGAA